MRNLRNSQTSEEAADWAVRLDSSDLTADEKQRLAEWLLESPLHADELLLSASLLFSFSDVSPDYEVSLEALLEHGAPEIVPLIKPLAVEHSGTEPQTTARTQPMQFSGIAASIFAAIIVTAGVVSIGYNSFVSDEARPTTYATSLGEQRSVILDDNSVLHINTRSSIVVRYSEQYRLIELREGEALFDVESDPGRPFRVLVGETAVEALGTKFNINSTGGGGANISVLEGRVAVGTQAAFLQLTSDTQQASEVISTSQSAPSIRNNQRFILSDRQQANIQQDGTYELSTEIDTIEVTSWRLRRLTFDSKLLSEIAEEFNRYNRTQIIINDDLLSTIRLSGIFEADDPMSLIQFLELHENIIVDDSDPGLYVISRAGKMTE